MVLTISDIGLSEKSIALLSQLPNDPVFKYFAMMYIFDSLLYWNS